MTKEIISNKTYLKKKTNKITKTESRLTYVFTEPTVERGRTLSRISVAKGSNLNFRGRKSNSLMNLCGKAPKNQFFNKLNHKNYIIFNLHLFICYFCNWLYLKKKKHLWGFFGFKLVVIFNFNFTINIFIIFGNSGNKIYVNHVMVLKLSPLLWLHILSMSLHLSVFTWNTHSFAMFFFFIQNTSTYWIFFSICNIMLNRGRMFWFFK